MSVEKVVDINNFASGHLIVDEKRQILFCNDYICQLSELQDAKIVGTSISEYISKASHVFLDSYIYPLVINESVAEEIQITWIDNKGKKIPIIANIRLGTDNRTYWSVYVCTNRDKLQNEWLKANNYLEELSNELSLLATTDSLTGLLNRRELKKQSEKVIYQASRNLSTFALLFIDIDYFKLVNDTYGHQKGDQVIIHVAEILKHKRRNNDILARVGGEEFVLLLPDIDEQNAFKLAEKLRKNVADSLIEEINVTVSMGLIVTNKECDVSYDELLKLADKALYDAKESGRNKTCVAKLKDQKYQ